MYTLATDDIINHESLKGVITMNEKYLEEAKRIIAQVREQRLNEEHDESGYRKISHPSKLGNGGELTDRDYNHISKHKADHVIKIHRAEGDPDAKELHVHHTKSHTLVSSRGGYSGSEWRFKGRVHPRDVAANHKWAAKKFGGEDISTDHDISENVEHKKLSYDEFIGIGHHRWAVNYNHGRWRNKNVTVQTKEKSEDAARNHRFFKEKKGSKINSVKYLGVREK
jgi:hypothetical protein